MSNQSNPSPAPVVRSTSVNRSPEDTFRIFTEEIGAWWPLPGHGLFGDKSGGVAFRNNALIEIAVDGTEAVWGEIRAWDPPHRLVFSWHPGGTEAESSEVEVLFEASGDGTRVVLEHRGWEVFGADALARRRTYIGPNAWGHVLDHFADSTEPQATGIDVEPLRAAYADFFAEASQGGFGAAPHGQWDASHVVAHVALNDAAMLNVCQALVHGTNARFENQTCQDLDVLGSWIDAHGDFDGLIARGQQTANQVIAAICRLSRDQRYTEVHCHLSHDGAIVLDGPRPWHVIAVTVQTTHHLPAHIEQLQGLRS